jgi:hypothetical protein
VNILFAIESAPGNASIPPTADCRIIVNSIGDAGARMVGVLKQVLPHSETRLAALLYQAPAELIGGLSRPQAEQINTLLRSTGLDSQVLGRNEAFTPGDASCEVALAIKETSNMLAIAQLIMELLGVKLDKARAILCTSPTVLMGHVSANTVAVLRRRFAPLEVELDVSHPAHATFDLFLGQCAAGDRERIKQLLRDLRLPLQPEQASDPQPLLAVGLSKGQADQLWEQLRRTSFPVRLVNRDFERFDLRLDQAPATPAMIDFLVTTTGMPARVARKVVDKTPVIIQQNIPFARMSADLEQIAQLGGQASGHLLAFQVFSLVVEKVGDVTATMQLLQALGGLSPADAHAAINPSRPPLGAMTNPQARWLQQELKRVGSESRVILR